MQKLIREFGSEFDLASNGEYIGSDINQAFFNNAVLLRSGRDGLRAIAKKYNGLYNRLVLPALCCESMVSPFQSNGYDVVCFKLNNDLTGNAEDVLAKLQPNDVFLYMNYFGIQSFSDETLELIRACFADLIMIEDKTHDFFSSKCNGFVPNFTVCSIRKWLAIPDGGLLFSEDEQVKFEKENNTFFADIRTEGLKNKSEYLKFGNPQLKELFRSQLDNANDYMDNDYTVAVQSQESQEILREVNFNKIVQVRRGNIRALFEQLKNIAGIKHLQSFSSDNCVLYYPILVDNRIEIQKKLAENNIYCPVIWPLPPLFVGICEVSDYISEHILAIPCDQRYRSSDMEYISTSLKKILGA